MTRTKNIFPAFHKKAWAEAKAKRNRSLVTILSIALFIVGFFVIGSIVQPKTGSGASICMAASMIGLPFAKRFFREENTFFNGGGGSGETETEKKARLEKERKEFLGEIVKEFDAHLEKKGFNKLEPEKLPAELKAIKDEMEKLTKADHTATITELKRLVTEQGLELKSIKDKSAVPAIEYKSVGHELMSKLKEKKEIFEKAYGNREFDKPVSIELKAVVTEMDSTTIGAGATNYSLTAFTGIISKIRKRITVYLGLVSTATITSPNVYWIEETTEEGTPIFIGEGDTKTQLSVLYVEKTAVARKIAVYGKMSWEWMKDLAQLVAYFQNNLLKRLDIATEDQLISGNGAGNNLVGIMQNAVAFDAGTLLNTVTDANEFDVVIALANQVKKAFGSANAILVNPDTGAKMRTAKTSLGQPVMGMYGVTQAEELIVNGVRIIETTAITAGEFVGGDLSVMNVMFVDGMNIRIGETGNDLIQNLKTVVLEQRLVQFESANDYRLIVKGTFANAIAQLDAEVSGV